MDIQRTMQFILEQQAQHAVEIQQLRERDAALSSKMETLTGSILKVVEVQTRQQDMIASLITGMSQLVDDQRETRQDINMLVKIVDQLVRRNGGQSSTL